MSEYLKYLPFVLIALLTLIQVYVRFSARRMRGRSLSGDTDLLEPKWLTKDKLVIYFSSPYCGPCKTMAPMIEQLALETGNVLKLDAMAHGALASRLGARGAPAFVQVERGGLSRYISAALTRHDYDRCCNGCRLFDYYPRIQ